MADGGILITVIILIIITTIIITAGIGLRLRITIRTDVLRAPVVTMYRADLTATVPGTYPVRKVLHREWSEHTTPPVPEFRPVMFPAPGSKGTILR